MIDNLVPDFIKFRIKKDITRLFKLYLGILEDIKTDHKGMIDKLVAEYGPNFIDAADWLTPDRAAAIRKKILDEGNQSLRDILEEIDKFYIEFKS